MAKQLTMRDIVKALLASGHQVEYRERTDRGIRVTMIDGVRFKSSESLGNTKARSMVGAEMSEARIKQLKKISIKKGTKRDFVSQETRDKIKQINENLKAREKALRKKGAQKVKLGRVRLKNYRENRKFFGEEKANEMLESSLRYSQGLALFENIDAIVKRLHLDADSLPADEASIFRGLANELEQIRNNKAPNFKHEYLQEIIYIIYDREHGTISTEEMAKRIKPWIDLGK